MPCSISIITVAMLIAPMYLRSITRILKGCCVPAETRVALIQRSCGYALRPTLSIDAIEETVQAIKACSSECIVIVDNCYGEFTERLEPCHVSVHPTII